MELDDLVRAIRRGDRRAWNELSRRLQLELARYFRTSKRDEIADLSQRTLLVIVKKFPEFELRENEPFLHWVFGIARFERLRAQRRRDRDAELERRYIAAWVSPPRSTGPVTRADRLRYRKWLEQAMQRLSTPYQEALQNELDGGDAGTLAERRGITRAHARVLKSRAYEQLRRLRREIELPSLPASGRGSAPSSK